jgi:hypothetical protein
LTPRAVGPGHGPREHAHRLGRGELLRLRGQPATSLRFLGSGCWKCNLLARFGYGGVGIYATAADAKRREDRAEESPLARVTSEESVELADSTRSEEWRRANEILTAVALAG